MKSLDKSSLMKGIPAFWSGIVLLLGGLGVGGANGETLNFHHYDTDDGLPQVQVLSVYRDPVGYLWIGTYGGLSRYNGQSFKNYTTEDGLGANVVEAVIADEEGRLWAGTGAGLCRLGADAERFECLDEGALGGAYVYDLHLHEGTLWAATNVGFFRLNGKSVEHFGKSDGLPVEDVRSIARDGSGGLWIGTTGGLAVRDPGAGEFRTVRFPPDAGRHVSSLQAEGDRLWVGTDRGLLLHSDGRVRAPEGIPAGAASADVADIALDKKGDLWVATNLGVLWRRGGDFMRLTRENGLRYNLTFSLYADGEGLVWIGHDQGLTKWVPSPFVGYLAKHGLLDPFVRTINEDAKGRLWLGTRRGIQIVPHIDGKWRFDESKIITVDDGLRDERVYSIAFPRPGVAMVATDNGVAFWQEGEGIVRTLTTADGLPANQTQALLHDRRGRTWIGTNLGTVILENGEIRALEGSLLGETYIYRFREDARGRIWAAGRDGVFIVDPGGTITRLTAEDGLSDRTLWDLAPDGNGGMWAGSNGDGLFHVSADLDVERFTTEDGLVDNFIWQVLQDSRGDVWAYTNHGLSRFDGDRFRNFGRNDGLLHEEGGATGAWESHTGDLWFASADGLMRYDPALADRGPPTPRS